MRIKETIKKHKITPRRIALLSFLFVCGIISALLLKPFSKSTLAGEYFCGAETFENGQFINGNLKFNTNCIQTKSEKYKGNASCLCSDKGVYGPTWETSQLKAGDTIHYSLAIKSDASTSKLVLSSDKGDYLDFPLPAENKWQVHTKTFVIPAHVKSAVWKIYPYKISGSGKAYYDNMNIAVSKSNRLVASNNSFSRFELQINNENYDKIRRKRKEALGIGLLFSSKDDLVDANIRVDSSIYDSKVRLKGDLLDHLQGNKWSFRIMLDKGQEWRGMNVFSIHNSAARSHLAEWFMHKIMEHEGVMTPKYDFMKFSFNKRDIGTYAYEQHFDNYFLQENKKPIAPIIRHNDDGYWDNVKKTLKDYEWVAASQVELFNKENAGDPNFDKLFRHGHSQLTDFLNKRKSADEVFDLDKMARYYALMEIGHGTHAQLVTNIRFYVDPVTGLLEPIGYDFFGDHLPKVNEHWRPVGMWENGKKTHERSRDGNLYNRVLFGNEKFYRAYIKYLTEYTKPEYLTNQKARLQHEIDARTSVIKTDPDYRDYSFDMDKVFAKAKYTKDKLYPLPGVSLTSYRTAIRHEVQLQNYHYFPLEIIGYKTKNQPTGIDLAEPIIMESYSPHTTLEHYKFVGKQKPTEVIYRTLGTDSTYYHKVNNNLAPLTELPIQSASYYNISDHPSVNLNGDQYTLNSKKITLDRHYKVDKNQALAIASGSNIIFQKGGSLTVYGSLMASGSSSEPITFNGKKLTGQGILIGKGGSGIFNHCQFANLSNYNVGIANLPAVVNIYEATVNFTNCNFIKNDAIFIVDYTGKKCGTSENIESKMSAMKPCYKT